MTEIKKYKYFSKFIKNRFKSNNYVIYSSKNTIYNIKKKKNHQP